MKLNKDCVRDILIYIEEKSVYEEIGMGKKRLHIVSFDELCKSNSIDHGNDIINYALEKMEEHNLIKFNSNKNHSSIDRCFINYHISEITNKGHEFLDNVKNLEHWNKIKTAIENAGINDCSLNMYFDYIYNETQKSLNGKQF